MTQCQRCDSPLSANPDDVHTCTPTSEIMKNCPFCGSHPWMIIHTSKITFETYQPICSNEECKAMLPQYHDAKLAKNAWDRRCE